MGWIAGLGVRSRSNLHRPPGWEERSGKVSVRALLRDPKRAAGGNAPCGNCADFGRSWKSKVSVSHSRKSDAFRRGRFRPICEHTVSSHEGGMYIAAVVESGSPPRLASFRRTAGTISTKKSPRWIAKLILAANAHHGSAAPCGRRASRETPPRSERDSRRRHS